MNTGIKERPDWYPQLTIHSSFEDFQASIAQRGVARCTAMPCPSPPAASQVAPPVEAAPATGPCHTAEFGSDCYNRVMWVMRSGIAAHPDWYPTLDLHSTFEEIQHVLVAKGEDCHERPCPAARNPFPRTPDVSTSAECNSWIPVQVVGAPDTWGLSDSMQDECFEKMHAVRQQGELQKDHFVVSEDRQEMKGRNWCWVGFKEWGCHRRWSDRLTWAEMQHLAVQSSVTIPLEFRPLQDPELCDRTENGAMRDWTPDEKTRASEWLKANVAVYVLSLPNSPRRGHVQKCLNDVGVSFNFVDGLDIRQPGMLLKAHQEGWIPKDFNFERAQANAYSAGQNMAGAGSIVGTIGCAAAHFRAQRSELAKPVADRKPITLIFEDDICPERDFVEKLWSLVLEELPCDWEVVSLYSRCPFGRCVSYRLTRVQPDTNEPMWRCRHGVNWGFQGVMYRTAAVEALQARWKPMVFDASKPNCLYLDNALAAISDRVNFYAVPAAQSPGFLRELDYGGSERIQMNYAATAGSPWHSCTTYGCVNDYRPWNKCQCNEACKKFDTCCYDYDMHCKAPGPTLYCFAVMTPGGEQALLSMQAQQGRGIFACEAKSVFSNMAVDLGGDPAVWTTDIDHDLRCGVSPQTSGALNTEIFTKVWAKVFAEGLYVEHAWTVKVDPDTVFFPGRLVEHLRPNPSGFPDGMNEPLYVLNCGIGLHGPIEVVSKAGMELFKNGGMERCIRENVTDWSIYGEDTFAGRCWAKIGVHRRIDFGILDETHCSGSPSPCISGKVAFHPFKDTNSWSACFQQATG